MRLPFLGDMLDLYRDLIGTFARIAQKRGDRAPLFLGPRQALLVSDPEDARRLLLAPEREARKSRYTKMMGIVFGESVLIAEGESWRRQRDYLNPLFSPKAIRAHAPIILAEARRLILRLRAEAQNGHAFEAVWECRALVQRIMGRILFGDLFSPARVERLMDDLQAVNDGLFGEFIRKSIPIGPLGFLSASGAKKLEASALSIGAFIDELLGLEIADDDASLAAAIVRAVPEGPGRAKEIKDQITVLFYAGQDTTARALAWTLYFLAENPQWIAAIRKEARCAFVAETGDIETKALPKTLSVIREAMRLRPVAYAIDRELGADGVLDCPMAKKGVIAPIAVSNIHRAPAHWTDPDRFEPGRFTAEGAAGRHPCAYIPFGHGRRKCLGASLAEFEMTFVIALFCEAFDFCRADNMSVSAKAGVTLAPYPEVRLSLKEAPAD